MTVSATAALSSGPRGLNTRMRRQWPLTVKISSISGWRGGVWLERGEFLIVPRRVEHRPVAEEEVAVLLFEPAEELAGSN